MQFTNRERIIDRVSKMPKGESSPSNHYWCETCKMLFSIDSPVCPYMTKVCINTPIPVELIAPESTISLEKFGLFYPKIPQKIMDKFAVDNLEELGIKWANAYLEFLKEWKFPYQNDPLQTLKSFLILISGSETAQRVQKEKITFVITDINKNWEKEKLFKILESSIKVLKTELNIKQHISFDEIDIIGETLTGKYYCGMCQKFFEFSTQKDSITCPLMLRL